MEFEKVTPVLRIFDESKTREFYVDFLDFKIDWEHRLEEGLPLYMQVSKGQCLIHLTEHHGCLLYTSPSPRDATLSRMPSSA